MRPDIEPPRPGDDPRGIIYLGDVRRKRASRRRAPDRHYLASLILIALTGWAVWLAVLVSLAPARLLTYLAFFVPLAVALAATGAIGAYAVEWKRGSTPGLIASGRRGLLFAAVAITNLALLAAHHWSLAAFGVAAVAAVAIDVGMSRHDR